MIYRDKNRAGQRTMAIVMVCLFLINDIVWANPDLSHTAKSGTLARWLVTKALTDAGVDDPATVELEVVTGIDFLAMGMDVRTVNSILTENASRVGIEPRTELLSCVRQDDSSIIARFRLTKEKNRVLDVSRDKAGNIKIVSCGAAPESRSAINKVIAEYVDANYLNNILEYLSSNPGSPFKEVAQYRRQLLDLDYPVEDVLNNIKTLLASRPLGKREEELRTHLDQFISRVQEFNRVFSGEKARFLETALEGERLYNAALLRFSDNVQYTDEIVTRIVKPRLARAKSVGTDALVLYNLKLRNDNVDLNALVNAIERSLMGDCGNDVHWALLEIIKNAVIHGNGNTDNNIVVIRWHFTSSKLIIDIIDQGKEPIDFSQQKKLPPMVSSRYSGYFEGFRTWSQALIDKSHFIYRKGYDFPLEDNKGNRAGQIVRLMVPIKDTQQLNVLPILPSETINDKESEEVLRVLCHDAVGFAVGCGSIAFSDKRVTYGALMKEGDMYTRSVYSPIYWKARSLSKSFGTIMHVCPLTDSEMYNVENKETVVLEVCVCPIKGDYPSRYLFLIPKDQFDRIKIPLSRNPLIIYDAIALKSSVNNLNDRVTSIFAQMKDGQEKDEVVDPVLIGLDTQGIPFMGNSSQGVVLEVISPDARRRLNVNRGEVCDLTDPFYRLLSLTEDRLTEEKKRLGEDAWDKQIREFRFVRRSSARDLEVVDRISKAIKINRDIMTMWGDAGNAMTDRSGSVSQNIFLRILELFENEEKNIDLRDLSLPVLVRIVSAYIFLKFDSARVISLLRFIGTHYNKKAIFDFSLPIARFCLIAFLIDFETKQGADVSPRHDLSDYLRDIPIDHDLLPNLESKDWMRKLIEEDYRGLVSSIRHIISILLQRNEYDTVKKIRNRLRALSEVKERPELWDEVMFLTNEKKYDDVTSPGVSQVERESILDAAIDQVPPNVNFGKIEKLLFTENATEKQLLSALSKLLNGTPVNDHIDLSAIPKDNEQLKQNMKTLARIIALNQTFNLNIRYVLENDTNGQAMTLLRSELIGLSKIPGVNGDELLLCIGIPHVGDNVINVHLATIENIGKLGVLSDRQYAVALKEDSDLFGVSIPNYTAASAIGLSLAALRVAKDKEVKDGYESMRGKVFDIISSIYKRFGIIKEDREFTVDDLEFMVSGCPANKLKYAILYALPPIVKDLVERLGQYHEALQLMLQAA
jgi:hypothetical protein